MSKPTKPASPALQAHAANMALRVAMEVQTVRDEFAGQALCGLQMHPTYGENSPEWLADEAYEIADAMMRRRAKCTDVITINEEIKKLASMALQRNAA